MATTTRGIETPDLGTAYNPPVDLAHMADTIEAMAQKAANYGVGTTSERTAALADFSDGAKWYDTTLSAEYRRVSGAWVEVEASGGAYNYVWADATARGAETGMIAGEKGYQTDTAVEYKYDGTVWVISSPVYCSVRKTGNQSLTTTPTALVLDAEITDPHGMHDNVTNNTRITAVTPGVYQFTVSVYNSNTSGMGTLAARLNGTTMITGSRDRKTGDATGGTPLKSVFPRDMAVGDYVELLVTHSTTAGIIVGGTDEAAATVTALRIGP